MKHFTQSLFVVAGAYGCLSELGVPLIDRSIDRKYDNFQLNGRNYLQIDQPEDCEVFTTQRLEQLQGDENYARIQHEDMELCQCYANSTNYALRLEAVTYVTI